MNVKTGVALALGVLVASQGAAQDVSVGTRVRITTRLGLRYRGQLTAVDSTTFSVLPDGSMPAVTILRSDVKKFEKSAGMEEVKEHPVWAEAATWAAGAGGAWYGATGWGHNSHPRGVLGGVLGFVAFGAGAAYLLQGFGDVVMEEQWKKVKLESEVRPVITSGAGGRFLVGVSFSLR